VRHAERYDCGSSFALRTVRTRGLSSDCERANGTPEIRAAPADAPPNRLRRKHSPGWRSVRLGREGRRLQRDGRRRAVHAFSGRGEAVEDRADRRRILDGAEQAEAPPAPMSSIGSKSRWRVPSAQAVFSVSRMRSSPMRRSRSGTVENGYPR